MGSSSGPSMAGSGRANAQHTTSEATGMAAWGLEAGSWKLGTGSWRLVGSGAGGKKRRFEAEHAHHRRR